MADGRDAIAAGDCRSALREVDGPQPVPATAEVRHLAKGIVREYEPAVQLEAPPRKRGGVRLDTAAIACQRVLPPVHQPIEAGAVQDPRAKGLPQGPARNVLDDHPEQ